MPFIETVGRFFFEKNRSIFFFSLLLAPFAASTFFLSSRYLHLKESEEALDKTALQARASIDKREKKARFLERYAQCEPYFINQHLESLPLLQKELERLVQMQRHPACSDQTATSRRIAFLQSSQNRLRFAEETVRSTERVKETEEKLQHTVEIDGADLNRLLSLIENIPIGEFTPHPSSPQLLIYDFMLSKKDLSVYKLNLALLKREFSLSNEKKN